MKKELGHFTVGDKIGGNQDWFSDRWMRLGGCGAVTACDLCIYLAKHMGLTALYPFDAQNVTKEDYVAFGMQMRAYLGPRSTGIDKTEIYVDGFYRYLAKIGAPLLHLRGVSGNEDVETAVRMIREQIDSGIPVPYLMLLHRDIALSDYMWHWFLLNGYDETDDWFLVKSVTYNTVRWFDLRHLWKTGRRRKGGFVAVSPAES